MPTDAARLDRIEDKLDTVITLMRQLLEFAVADADAEDEPTVTLDGEPAGAPREPGESLG